MNYRTDLQATLPEGRVNSQWFYDCRGSELFEQITKLPEYYPTRTEIALLRRHSAALARFIGPNATLVEYGAGALTKIRILLDALQNPRAYRPLDVSGEFVAAAADGLQASYPSLAVEPIIANFTEHFDFGGARGETGLFLGSTIGNLEDAAIIDLLTHARQLDRFLLGVDLAKDEATLLAAYNDAQGITAHFNLNLLHRANREANAGFEVADWRHIALWNAEKSQIEMHLEAVCDTTSAFRDFAAGSRLLTEISRKFTPEILAPLLAESGWEIVDIWFDPQTPYAILGLT